MKLTVAQKVDVLMATSPIRFLLKDHALLWVSWDGKTVALSGVKVGDVEWSRHVTSVQQKMNAMDMLKFMFGFRSAPAQREIKDFSVIDLLGQRWLGRGYLGENIGFVKCKEI